MNKFIFKCTECETIKIWETNLELPADVQKCICGYAMVALTSDDYKYGNI